MDDAIDQLDSIIEDYARPGRQFTCYHDDNHETVIIKTVNLSAVIHSWIWPALAFIAGIVIALLAYYEKIGQPPPHDEDDDDCDKETIVQEINGKPEKKEGISNRVGVIDENESETEADMTTEKKSTTEDKMQLTGTPSKEELYNV